MNKLLKDSKVNSMPSLDYLAKTFLHAKMDKELTISEWKLWPLDPHLLDYAWYDSHLLLYLFGILVALMDPHENIKFTPETYEEIKPILISR